MKTQHSELMESPSPDQALGIDDLVVHVEPTVPNQFPSVDGIKYKIAIVGEAPGIDEIREGKPFVGAAGRLMNALLARCNILRAACFIGNVSQHRPPNNDITKFDWNGPEIQGGLAKLKADLQQFQPNVVILLGNTALAAFHPNQNFDHNDHSDKSDAPSISAWRGSILQGSLDGYNVKVIPTYHPASALRVDENIPYILFDFKRSRGDGEYPELNLPIRHFDLNLSAAETIARLDALPADARVSIDIEGGTYGIPCISFTDDPAHGFIVAFIGGNSTSRWSVEDEVEVWRSVKRVCENPLQPKVLQNSLYDRFVLAYAFGILIRNVKYDTMLMHWERYCEMKKSLAVQASIYTREPYYKEDRTANDLHTFFEYCCKDSAVTLEIQRKIDGALTVNDRSHCDFNHAMLNPMLYMELRGIRYDSDKAAAKREELQKEINGFQVQLDALTGTPLNVKSWVQKQDYLYRKLGLPVQFIKGKNKKITSNDEAILRLWKKTARPELELMLNVIRRRTIMGMLKIKTDKDGRVRGAYSVVGTETGRISVKKSPTGSGTNLQTTPDENTLYTEGVMREGLRVLLLADIDHDMCQVDLEGADNWTVGAHCMRLGDPNMILDLKAKIKPAKVLVLMTRGVPIPHDRAALAALCEGVSKNDPLYFAAKQVCHGSNYGMQPKLVSERIFIESDGMLNITVAECLILQNAYFQHYPGVKAWQRWVQEQVKQKRELMSASLHTRRFFGNPYDQDTYNQAYSDEPQANTTYCTNKFILALWRDPANRVAEVRPEFIVNGIGQFLRGAVMENTRRGRVARFGDRVVRAGSVIIEPLHQVHDAGIQQWPTVLRDWARERVKAASQQTLTIAGQQIIIPGEGNFGPSWGELHHKL